ncbi:MAG: pilus assembly protein N-terminal domain-containing protein [Methyloligellaceae bacterium]
MRSNSSPRYKWIMGALASFLIAALFVGLYAGLARANEFRVEIDQAKLIRLDKPGAEVIIGNPSIADVSVQNGRLLAVTGKSAGLTNIMVLDGRGNLTYSKKIFVSADTKRLVTVNKGTSRFTYSCSPICAPTLIPGDTEGFFEPLAKEIRNKLGLAQSAVDGTTTQQQ